MRRATLSLLGRGLVGGVFVWAGVSKLVTPDPLMDALDWLAPRLGLAPAALDAAREVLARAEVVLGLCLLTGLYLRPALVAAGLTLLAFAGVLLAGSRQRGGIASCGCFGERVLDSGGPIVWIGRNVVLAAFAFAAAWGGSRRFALDGLLSARNACREGPRDVA